MSSATPLESANETCALFKPDACGRVRQWLVAGPRETPYAGPIASDQIMRRDALDYARAEPPVSASAGAAGPFGLSWEFHYAGRNDFIEFSTFYQQLTVVEYWAAVEILASADGVYTYSLNPRSD